MSRLFVLCVLLYGCYNVGANRCLNYEVTGTMFPDRNQYLMGSYDRSFHSGCDYVYQRRTSNGSTLYLYGYENRLGEDDKAVAQEQCSSNISNWLLYTVRSTGYEYGYNEGWHTDAGLRVQCTDCPAITTNFSNAPTTDYKKEGYLCNERPVYYSSQLSQYIFYNPYPLENITDENITGWLVGPTQCSAEGIVAASYAVLDPTRDPWEIFFWLVKFDYGWDTHVGIPLRCAGCQEQTVTGETSYDQFRGAYQLLPLPACERLVYSQQQQNGTGLHMIRKDYAAATDGENLDYPEDPDIDKQWFFVEADDPCGDAWTETIRSPVTADLDVHEVSWEEYKAGEDWWQSVNLRISCTEKESGAFANLIAAIVGGVLAILLCVAIGVFIYFAVAGTITVCFVSKCDSGCCKKSNGRVTPDSFSAACDYNMKDGPQTRHSVEIQY